MNHKNIITINGHEFSFIEGQTILQVARKNGINIPTLCYLKGASPTGRCRICIVEIEGVEDLKSACSFPAESKMTVRTDTPRVISARRKNIETLLASGHHNCLAAQMDGASWTDFQLNAMDAKEHQDLCPAYGDCRLQELAIKYRVKGDYHSLMDARYPIEDVNPFIVRDFSRCILCGRCVQACNEIQVNNVLSIGYEDADSKIITKGDLALKDSNCVFCGQCLQACPVGALYPQKHMLHRRGSMEVKKVRTTCSYCGVGCQLYLHIKDNEVVEVSAVEDVPPNYGRLCVKGRFGYDFINHPDRLKTPLIRENDGFREASWEEALTLVGQKITRIKEASGPDVIGVFTSARVTNEENYLAQKFARVAIGTNNIDHCARL